MSNIILQPQLELDVAQFWRDDALAHEENCFSPKAPQVALGIRMSHECVFAELGVEGHPWDPIDPVRQAELNKRYNDKAEKIAVGIFRKISIGQRGPDLFAFLRAPCISVSREIDKKQLAVDLVKINGNGFSGRRADTRKGVSPKHGVDQRAFSNVGAPGKSDLRDRIARELLRKTGADTKLGAFGNQLHENTLLSELLGFRAEDRFFFRTLPTGSAR
jgi:hypothetical protein